jgi:DNA-binding NarL/FixJ family response regulator
MDRYRIVIADDHPLIRQGIRKIIEENPNHEVVGEVGDGLALLDFLKEIKADLVVLDISMPNLRGLEAISEVYKICPEIKILMLTMHKSEKYLCSALSLGANGYLLKEDSDSELLPAIEKVKQGGLYVSPYFEGRIDPLKVSECVNGVGDSQDILTMRERQVLCLIAEGATSKGVAEALDISKRTVEHHRANMMRKLQIKTTTDLIKYAIGKGYITPPE